MLFLCLKFFKAHFKIKLHNKPQHLPEFQAQKTGVTRTCYPISMVSVGLRQLVSNNILVFYTLPIKMIGMSKVIPIKMNDVDALSILHGCVANDSRVFISPHAKERMLERNITLKQVLACIEKGRITESPYRDVRGDWRCSIEHYTSGNAVTVAIAFKYNNSGERIVVVTVF